MIIKIGGVEIDRSLDTNGIEQLQEGLGEIGIDTATKAITWASELSLQERIDLYSVVSEWTFDTAVSFFTLGIF